MAGESDDLDKLFESVADGESVDWDAREREAPDEETRALIRQLRLIAEVADVHRSQVDEVALAEDASLTAPPCQLAVLRSRSLGDVESGPSSMPLQEGADYPEPRLLPDPRLRRTSGSGDICSSCARLARARTARSFTRTTPGSITPLH